MKIVLLAAIFENLVELALTQTPANFPLGPLLLVLAYLFVSPRLGEHMDLGDVYCRDCSLPVSIDNLTASKTRTVRRPSSGVTGGKGLTPRRNERNCVMSVKNFFHRVKLPGKSGSLRDSARGRSISPRASTNRL